MDRQTVQRLSEVFDQCMSDRVKASRRQDIG